MFAFNTKATLEKCGWTATETMASVRYSPAITGRVWHDGRWAVMQNGQVVARKLLAGEHPCLAACDVNEIGWALREGRPVAERYAAYLVRLETVAA